MITEEQKTISGWMVDFAELYRKQTKGLKELPKGVKFVEVDNIHLDITEYLKYRQRSAAGDYKAEEYKCDDYQ